MSKIISFYKEEEHDVRDRSLSDLLHFGKDDLEVVHDYIQWLFPLREASNFNPNAPLVDDKDIAAFKKDRLLQRNLQRSYKTMLSFYGFEKDAETKEVSKTPDFDEAASN